MNDTTTKEPLRRSSEGFLGGVAGGLAKYLGIDVSLVRVGLLALLFMTGPLAVIGYGAAWAIIPGDGQIGRPEKIKAFGREWSPGQAVIGGVLVLIGASMLGSFSLGGLGMSTSTAVILGIIVWVLATKRGEN